MGSINATKSISERPRKVVPFVVRLFFGRLFFVPFFLAGVWIVYGTCLQPAIRVMGARNWVAVPCVVKSSTVETSHDDEDGNTYDIEIRFAYDYEGTRHHGDRYKFLKLWSSGRRSKQEVVDRYPVGSTQTCYVNPANPSESVLNRGATWDMLLMGLFGLPFLAIGGWGLFFGNRVFSTTQTRQVEPRVPHELMGPLKLKSDSSPAKNLLGAILIACFWNGIVSVFVVIMIKAFRSGHPEWFLTVFLIPFELIGLSLIGYVIHQFMALFNPRIQMMLDPGAPPIGGAVGLGYVLTGATQRLASIQIVLEGTEMATYRRGTTTTTDTSIFHRQVLVESSKPQDFNFGKATFVVPEPMMHSFKSKSNEIRWTIRVEGVIRHWPNLTSSFTIQVVPAKQGGTV